LFLLLLVLNCAVFSGLGVIVLNVRSLESVGLYNNFVIIPCLLGHIFDPATLPAASGDRLSAALTYTSIGLRTAHSPVSWYGASFALCCGRAVSPVPSPIKDQPDRDTL